MADKWTPWFPEEVYVEFWDHVARTCCPKEWYDKNWDAEKRWSRNQASPWSSEAVRRAFKPPSPVTISWIPDDVPRAPSPGPPSPYKVPQLDRARTPSTLSPEEEELRSAPAPVTPPHVVSKRREICTVKRRRGDSTSSRGRQEGSSSKRASYAQVIADSAETLDQQSMSQNELQGGESDSSDKAQGAVGFAQTIVQSQLRSSRYSMTAHASTGNEDNLGLTETGRSSVEQSQNQGSENGSKDMVKKHKCDSCGKAFKQSCNLRVHVRTHTQERPYKCSECDQSFTQKAHLTTHMRTHTGEKPYQCTNCPESFNRKDRLDNHQLTHTKEKPFKCDQCPNCYTRKQYLKNHKRKRHGGH